MISKSAIEEFHNRQLEDWSWLKEVPESDIQELLKDIAPDFNFKIKPYAHQLPCFVMGIKNNSFLFYLDPGTGKTLISISILDYLKQQNKLKSALILSPNISTVTTWADQTNLHSDLSYIELIGTAEERWKLMETKADLFFLNYTGLQVMTTETKKNQRTKKNEWVPIPQLIKKFQDKFNVVIYDESHYLKSRQSLNYEICNELSKTCEYRYGLSGTPFGKSPEDLWTQFHLIDRGETLGEYITLFRQAFFDVKVNRWGGYEYTFIKTYEKELNKRLQNKSIRYAEEECNSLPDKIYKKISIPFTKEQYEYYKHAVAGIIEAKGNITEIKNAFVRLRQITSGFLKYKDDSGEDIEIVFTENPKLDALCDFIQNLPEDEKIIVFNEYIKSGDIISERFKKLKIKHSRLYGGTKDKKEVKETFLGDKDCKVFLANSQAAGTGVDGLQHVARYIVYYESPVSSILRRQTEKRCIHKGQLVMCKDGFKKIEDVVVGDIVYTHKGNWKPVIGIDSILGRNKICVEIEYCGFNENLKVTDDHELYVYDKEKDSFGWIQAKELHVRKHYLTFYGGFCGVGVHKIKLELPFDTTGVSKLGTSYRKARVVSIPTEVILDDDLLYAFGFYVAEGWATITKGRTNGSSVVAVCGNATTEVERVLKVINTIASKFNNLNVYTYEGKKNCIQALVYSKNLAYNFREWFGESCYTKKFPDWVFDLSKEQLLMLLKGYFDGDGYRRNNTQQIGTVSSILITQLSILLTKLGHSPFLFHKEKYKNYSDFWVAEYSIEPKYKRILHKNGYTLFPINKVIFSRFKKANAQERVYDLTVEDDASFVVGAASVHNCHRSGQKRRTFLVDLIIKNSIDERVLAYLKEGKDLFDALLADPKLILED